MKKKYCIGKTIRDYGKCVIEPQWVVKEGNKKYSTKIQRVYYLRSLIFDTEEEAQVACDEISWFYDFKTLLLVPKENVCPNCRTVGKFIPDVIKCMERLFFSDWEYDICEVCNGKGYVDDEH